VWTLLVSEFLQSKKNKTKTTVDIAINPGSNSFRNRFTNSAFEFADLNIKSEINNVTIMDDVFFSFEPDFAGCLQGLFAAKLF